MLFTIEPKLFASGAQKLGQGAASRESADRPIRLTACEGNLKLEGAGAADDVRAVVWESGQCRVSAARLQRLLRTCRDKDNITVGADSRGLRIGTAWIPVISYCPSVMPPKTSPEEMATD